MKLKLKRVGKQISQEELADKIGISRQTYVSKELGIRPFKADEIMRLLKFFKCKFEDLF